MKRKGRSKRSGDSAIAEVGDFFLFLNIIIHKIMKRSFFILIFMPLLLSCSQKKGNNTSGNSIRQEVIDVAIKYAKDKFKESKETVAAGGIVTIADNQVNFVTPSSYQIRYVIDPSKIITGLINDDSDEDAIVYVAAINGEDLEAPENLILIKTEGKFTLSRVIESNMRVLEINDRIIKAEVSTRSLNSPLRDCHVCKEVVKYKFKSGDLIRMQE
jgi:hypothetical protein